MGFLVLTKDVPVRENEAVGDDEAAGFEFFLQFVFELFHAPRQEVNKHNIGAGKICSPEITPEHDNVITVWGQCFFEKSPKDKERVYFQADCRCPFFCRQKQEFAVAGAQIVHVHPRLDTSQVNHHPGRRIGRRHKRRAGDECDDEKKDKERKQDMQEKENGCDHKRIVASACS